MAIVLKDRVKVAATTTGTGVFTLGAAANGYQNFAAIGNGSETYYTIAAQAGSEWEVGKGTITDTAGVFTLSRDTVLESSNAGSLVDFSAGTKDVFVTYPAERAVYLDAAGSAVTALDIGTLGTSTANITTANITAGTVSTTPASGNDLVNKTYVDNMVSSGITYHEPVKYEVPNTTGNLNATYNNGTAGVGATLTNAGTLAAFAPDGPTASPGDRVLVYNQTNQFENGIYTVTTVGSGSVAWVLTRATDADSYGVKDPNALGNGDAFFITSGNTGAGETYVCNTGGTITFGTTAITFAQISDATLYTAGTGLTLFGTEFSITNTGTAGTYGSASQVPVFATNAQGQVTSVTPTAIAIAAAAVSGLAASATTDTTNAANITAGTLPVARLNGSYTGITGVGTIAAGTWNGSTVAAAYGGTGQSSYAVGDLLYANTTTSLAKLPDVIAGNALLSGGVGTAPAWGKVGLQTHVNGTLAIVNGGTGATTRQDAMDALAGAVTSGQYLRGNGTDVVMSAIQAADVPTLNQNTTGTAANVTGTVAIVNGGTGATNAATALSNLGAYPASNPNGYTSNTGTVTSVAAGSYLTGGTITTSGTLAVDATSANTASKVVARDASGNFSAGTVFASLNGTAVTTSAASSIQGLTVGLGAGNVSTNTAVGVSALSTNNTAAGATAVGYFALKTQAQQYTYAANVSSFGSGYTDGSYTNVSLIDQTATYTAVFNYTVSGGELATATLVSGPTPGPTVNTFYNVPSGTGGVIRVVPTDNTAAGNTAVGAYSQQAITYGGNNTSLGANTLRSQTTAGGNTAVGWSAGYSLTTGSATLYGWRAGYSLTTGASNLFIGNNSGFSVTTASNNTIIGSFVGVSAPDNFDISASNGYVVLAAGSSVRMVIGGNTGANVWTRQNNITTKAAAATLTGAEVANGILQYTGGAANLTLPTGTDLQTAVGSIPIGYAMDWVVINTGSGAATVVVNTNITAVGSLVVTNGTSARFRIRKTNTNTYVIYRTS